MFGMDCNILTVKKTLLQSQITTEQNGLNREENILTFSLASNSSIDSISDPGSSSPSGNG